MANWKVYLTARALNQVGGPALKALESAGCQLIHSKTPSPLSSADLIANLEGIDAVLISPDKFTPEVFQASSTQSLKIVSRWGVGYDTIDTTAATKAGVVVSNTPGTLNDAVADYAFALLLGVARRIHDGYSIMRGGEWKSQWGHDIYGKTLGIIGCGQIGQAMAKRASGFDMKLLGYDVAVNPAAEKLGVKFVSLDELLAQSDFVSLHAALTPQNKGMIGEAQLRRMKPSAYLINTARGAHIDEAALVKILQEGKIAGAAVDAYTVEPLAKDHPLRTAPNCLLTPHQAAFAQDTGERVSLAAAHAIIDLMNGRRPNSVVNPDVFESKALKAKLV